MQIVTQGKASIYVWSGSIVVPHSRTVRSPDPVSGPFEKHIYTLNTYGGNEVVVLFIHDKTYTPTTPFIKRNFTKFFGDCPKLIELSNAPDFNYEDLEAIVSKYNACFSSSSVSH
jgi:hypothetical protein